MRGAADMGRKYVFFDIDHTLVSYAGEKHIPPETREAVRRLREAGHVPAIAMGRGEFLSRRVANELDIGLLVCANGGHIFNGDAELYSAWLPEGALAALRETTARFPGETAALGERYIYMDAANPEWERYFTFQAGYPCLRPLAEMTRALMGYLMMPPEEAAKGDYGLFSEPPEGVRLEFMHGFVEARPAGTTKWRGIELAARHLGAGTEDVVTFGDGVNDVEMLRNAPVSVAVGRSDPQAKEAASLVTDDIDAGGILKACLELGLIR